MTGTRSECMKSEMDIFTDVPTQTCIHSSKIVSHTPVSNITDTGPIEFLIPKTDEYMDLASSYLTVTAKIVKSDGTDLHYVAGDAGNSKVAPANLWMHSLFRQVDLELNGVMVSQPTGNYPQRAMLETITHFGEDAKESMLTSVMYYKDKSTGMEDTDPWAARAGCRREASPRRPARMSMPAVAPASRFLQSRCRSPRSLPPARSGRYVP